jgi:hypothetical protein
MSQILQLQLLHYGTRLPLCDITPRGSALAFAEK